MTSGAQPRTKRARAGKRRGPAWVPWTALGLLVVILMVLAMGAASPGLLSAVKPARLWARLTWRTAPPADAPLSLTVIHSNDTYGYVLPCG